MALLKKLKNELQGLPCAMKTLNFGASLYIFINPKKGTAIQVYAYYNKDGELIMAPGRWQSIKYNTKGEAYINTKRWGRQYFHDFYFHKAGQLLD